MRRTLTVIAPLALVLGLLSGCGGNSEDSAYCKDLKADKAQFESMSGGDVGQLGDAFDAMHELADEAPDEVKDDWKTIDDAITAIEDAMDEAGVSADDLAGMANGDVPKDVDLTALQDLGTKLQDFGTEMAQATEAIDKNAQDVCGVTLGSS